ncbi:MAG: hypothetical protein ACK5BD_00565 [Chitinophagaceae bacterium]
MKNLQFADDKILIHFISKKTLLNKGTTSIAYDDIVNMSVVKSKNKNFIIGFSILLISLGIYFWVDFGMVLSGFGVPFLFFAVKLPPSYLRVQNRNNEFYWVNVSEYKTEYMIDLIEHYKRNSK